MYGTSDVHLTNHHSPVRARFICRVTPPPPSPPSPPPTPPSPPPTPQQPEAPTGLVPPGMDVVKLTFRFDGANYTALASNKTAHAAFKAELEQQTLVGLRRLPPPSPLYVNVTSLSAGSIIADVNVMYASGQSATSPLDVATISAEAGSATFLTLDSLKAYAPDISSITFKETQLQEGVSSGGGGSGQGSPTPAAAGSRRAGGDGGGDDSDDSSNIGTIIGIAVGGAVGALVIAAAVLAIVLMRKRRGRAGGSGGGGFSGPVKVVPAHA